MQEELFPPFTMWELRTELGGKGIHPLKDARGPDFH